MRKYSQACEQNKEPILNVLKRIYKDCSDVLEIGSGTGQHAAFFATNLPNLTWQPSDLKENHSSIEAWAEEGIFNLKKPIELDVRQHPWPISSVDAVFCANVFHIISLDQVTHFYLGVGEVLKSKGVLLVYGPFSYAGKHTSKSNQEFDQYLKQHDPLSGVRDIVDLDNLAQTVGLELVEDYAMPVNNRCLVWQSN